MHSVFIRRQSDSWYLVLARSIPRIVKNKHRDDTSFKILSVPITHDQ